MVGRQLHRQLSPKPAKDGKGMAPNNPPPLLAIPDLISSSPIASAGLIRLVRLPPIFPNFS
jgi:hypothetical protein